MLTLNNISKQFGKGDTFVKAVNDVSLTLEDGESIAVMGPSGSGKTTLLHIVAGILTPDSGSVVFNGKNLYELPERKLTELRRMEIGVVFQSFNLIPTLTVKENIILPATADSRFSANDINCAANTLMERLELLHRRNSYPDCISGGEQQRTAIARALMMKCLAKSKGGLILADEPTGNLDSATSNDVCQLLKEICKDYEAALIIVTHNINVAAIASKTIIMEDGKLIGNGSIRAQFCRRQG